MEKIRITAVENNISSSITETFQTMLSMDLVKVGQVTDPGLNDTGSKGEVVVEKEKYGIRIVEIVDRKERMKSFW